MYDRMKNIVLTASFRQMDIDVLEFAVFGVDECCFANVTSSACVMKTRAQEGFRVDNPETGAQRGQARHEESCACTTL